MSACQIVIRNYYQKAVTIYTRDRNYVTTLKKGEEVRIDVGELHGLIIEPENASDEDAG